MDTNEKHLKLLDKLFGGTTTERENAFLSSLSEAEFAELFRQYSDYHWEKASGQMDAADAERMQKDIMNRISTHDSMLSKKTSKFLRPFLQLVACMAFALLCLYGGYVLSERQHEDSWFEVTADRGQRSFVTLPDGSTVALNSDSRIRYSTGFNKGERNVQLEGEAYFDVAENKDLPFVVTAQEMEITVLGTKFNVKAYDDEPSVTATLIQGKIKAVAGNMTEIITPNKMVVYDRELSSLKVDKVSDASAITEWKDGRLIFSGETLEEIARILERRYDVAVIFEDEICKGIRYNGLVRDNTLDNVLKLIMASSTVKCSTDGHNVVFASK